MIVRLRKATEEKDGGFTLVELIVVVVIIGVLAAIAVPIFLNQSEKAKKNADLATLSNAKLAVASYVADKGSSALSDPPLSALTPYGFPSSPVLYVHDVDGTHGYFVIEMTTPDAPRTITSQSGRSCSVWVNAANNTAECSGN